jgi:4-amino-4-deoxy-L-arabinose transferase-like glycosyltransferase
VSGDEGFYHYVAREMARSGDWFTLRFVGEPQLYETFLNAPVHYWLKAAIIRLFGDSYWTMRVLSGVFGLLSVLMTYRLTAYLADRRAALLASVIHLTTFQFVYWHSARTGELEPIVTFFITLSAYLFLRAVESDRGFVGHHLCVALLVNLKLPLALLPLLAEGAFFALVPSSRRRFGDWVRSGLPLVPIAFLWHGFQAARHWSEIGGVAKEFLESAGGATGETGGRVAGVALRLRDYGSWMWRGAFPYVLAYPFALLGVAKLAASEAASRAETQRWTFVVLQTLAIVAFFALISKRLAWYLIPCIPFLSAMVGLWLARLRQERHALPTILAIAGILAAAAWVRFPLGGVNPFSANVRWASDIDASWRTLFGVGASVGAPLTWIAAALAQVAGRAVAPARAARISASALAAVLVAIAMTRTLLPLRYVHHESEMARLRRELTATKESGAPLSYPIAVREQGILKAKYYFGDEFEVRPRFNVRDDVYFDLYPKNPPH